MTAYSIVMIFLTLLRTIGCLWQDMERAYCYEDLWLGALPYPAMLKGTICPRGIGWCYASTVRSAENPAVKTTSRFSCGNKNESIDSNFCTFSKHGDSEIHSCFFKGKFYSNSVNECRCPSKGGSDTDSVKKSHLCYAHIGDPPANLGSIAACRPRAGSSYCAVISSIDSQGRRIVKHDCLDDGEDEEAAIRSGCHRKVFPSKDVCVFSGRLSNVDPDCNCDDGKWSDGHESGEIRGLGWIVAKVILGLTFAVFIIGYFAVTSFHVVRRIKELF